MTKKTDTKRSLTVPVVRRPDESTQFFGRRRRKQIREWYYNDIPIDVIAERQNVTKQYVKEVLELRTEQYQWVPPPDVLVGPFPTREQALKEAPLVSSDKRRMTTDQAIARAIQFWRWYNAGLTYTEIGARHGISRERVRKVLEKYGFPSHSYMPDWRTGKPPRLPLIIDDIRETTYRRKVQARVQRPPEDDDGDDEPEVASAE